MQFFESYQKQKIRLDSFVLDPRPNDTWHNVTLDKESCNTAAQLSQNNSGDDNSSTCVFNLLRQLI